MTPEKQALMNDIAANHPRIAEHFKAIGRAEGLKAERERIAGIEALTASAPAHKKLIALLKADGKTTPEQAASLLLIAQRDKGSNTQFPKHW